MIKVIFPLCGLLLLVALLFFFRRQLSTFISPTKKLLSSEIAFLTLAILIGCFTIYGNFIWGDSFYYYQDAGSDTIHSYTPFYYDLIHEIREGRFSLWNFDYGLGSSVLTLQTWFCDPFNWILIIAGVLFGDDSISVMLVIVQTVRLLAYGLLFNRLLLFYCRRPIARIVGALLATFSGYLLWETHYWFATGPVFLCLLLLAFELLVQKWNRSRVALLALSVFMTLVFSVYLGFMNLLFLAFYGAFRLAYLQPRFSWKKYFQQIGKIALVVLSGCFMAGIILVPSAYILLFNSIRVTSGSLFDRIIGALTTFCAPNDIPFKLSRFIGNNLTFTGRNVEFGAKLFDLQIGCSAAAFVFGVLYCWLGTRKTHWRKRALMLVPVLLVLLYCFNGFLPSMFNFFAATTYRNSYAVIAIICMAIAFVIDRVIVPRKIPVRLVLVSGSLSVLFLIVLLLIATRSAKIIGIAEVLLLASFMFALVAYQRSGCRGALIASMVILLASSATDAYATTNIRHAYSQEKSPMTSSFLENSETQRAVDLILQQDDSLFRIEKTYWGSAVGWQDNWVHGYNGVSSYNSTLAPRIIRFYKKLWPEIGKGSIVYLQNVADDWNEPGLLSFLNVRYILSDEPLSETYLRLIGREGAVLIYENDEATSMGHIYGSIISETEAESLDITDRRRLIDSTLIIPDSEEYRASQVSDSQGIFNLEMLNEGALVGSITASGECIAAVSIPHDRGWHVYIGDTEVETFSCNYGFIGFAAPQGSYSIRLEYTPYGWKIGMMLSVLGLITLTILLIRVTSKYDKKINLANAAVDCSCS